MDKLLAKKPTLGLSSPLFEETLLGHTESVLKSFVTLFGTENEPTRLSQQWLRFFRLSTTDYPGFWLHGALTTVLHDIGKANSGFQEAVQGNIGAQVMRHEHLSVLLIDLLSTCEDSLSSDSLDVDLVSASVASHHLKNPFKLFCRPLAADRKSIRVLGSGLSGFQSLIESVIACKGWSLPAVDELWRLNESRFEKRVGAVKRRLHSFKRKCRNDARSRSLYLAVRSALIAADSAGSALTREGKDVGKWLKEAFDMGRLVSGEEISQCILEPRITAIRSSGRSFDWHDFQEEAEQLNDRALLLAPCGSGKTMAAWRWIRGRLSADERSRVIFLYPTRATASEGFRDYVGWAPEAAAGLITGTANYDLEHMFRNPDESRFGRDFTPEDRLFAIGFWRKKIFSATVDQFLGFMQNVYRSTCLLPLVCDSVLVFDEVHAFDRSLFSALKRFLRAFDIPVLCMTASLTAGRIEDLRKCGLEVFPRDPARYASLVSRADMKRYQIKVLDGETKAMEASKDAILRGRRVFWVVNTVDRCQRIARRLNGICYHSRFRLEDRNNRHEQVMKAFQQSDGRSFAVTTQVCEMSLDLDTQVLISETAPIASMIQRMGRCNRHAVRSEDSLGEVFLYAPETCLPYNKEDLEGVDSFLKAVDGFDLSQSELANLLDILGPQEVEVEKYAAFLQSGPWAVAREESLRDANDFTVDAILETDVECYLKLKRLREPCDGLILPAPRKVVRRDPRLGKYPFIVDASLYSPQFGLSSKPRSD